MADNKDVEVNQRFVDAVAQHMEWANESELKEIGIRLKNDKLATNAEKRLLRTHYAACMKALKVEVTESDQKPGVLPESETEAGSMEEGSAE